MELSLKVPAACQLGNRLKCEVAGVRSAPSILWDPITQQGFWHLGEAQSWDRHQRGLAGGVQDTVRALHTSLGNVTALLGAEIIIKFTLSKAATAWKMFLICQNNIT